MYAEPTILKKPREEARAKIEEFIQQGEALAADPPASREDLKQAVERWEERTNNILKRIFTSDEYAEHFKSAGSIERYRGHNIGFAIRGRSASPPVQPDHQKVLKEGTGYLRHLMTMLPEIEESPLSVLPTSDEEETEKALRTVETICSRFHRTARQLRERHAERPTFKIDDEYDVQDLLHSLLVLFFDDVEDEAPTPNYAGSAARIDFLIKKFSIGIEVKMTRTGMTNRDLADQLIEDMKRFKAHPQCRYLFFFVYDPGEYITKPTILTNELSGTEDNLTVKVLIVSKGY